MSTLYFSKPLSIESLHAVFVFFFPVGLLLNLHLLLLLSLLHGGLVVVHLVVHVILDAHALHWVILVKFVKQLQKHLVWL